MTLKCGLECLWPAERTSGRTIGGRYSNRPFVTLELICLNGPTLNKWPLEARAGAVDRPIIWRSHLGGSLS